MPQACQKTLDPSPIVFSISSHPEQCSGHFSNVLNIARTRIDRPTTRSGDRATRVPRSGAKATANVPRLRPSAPRKTSPVGHHSAAMSRAMPSAASGLPQYTHGQGHIRPMRAPSPSPLAALSPHVQGMSGAVFLSFAGIIKISG